MGEAVRPGNFLIFNRNYLRREAISKTTNLDFNFPMTARYPWEVLANEELSSFQLNQL